jgi:hypothetical protein
MNKLVLNFFLFFVVNLFTITSSYSQNDNNVWSFGLGAVAVDYYPTNEKGTGGLFNEFFNAADHWNFGIKLNASRILSNKFVVDGAFSFVNVHNIGYSDGHSLLYYAIDLDAQYHFLGVGQKFEPYVYGGFGYNYVEYFKGSGTLNIGLGANYWFSDNWGANLQAGYKYSGPNSELLSHFFYALGVVYRPGTFQKSGKQSWRHCF